MAKPFKNSKLADHRLAARRQTIAERSRRFLSVLQRKREADQALRAKLAEAKKAKNEASRAILDADRRERSRRTAQDFLNWAFLNEVDGTRMALKQSLT